MKLAAWHLDRGDEVRLHRSALRDMLEPAYDVVYGSVIFTRSTPVVATFRREFPDAIIGGTGLGDDWRTVEQHLGVDAFERYDYSLYPEFAPSLGFTMRGCRLACKFCVVPRKEGRPASLNALAAIYRGEPHPRHIILLDNDFFGQPREQWEARLDEIRVGEFRVNFNQGINVRLINAEVAAGLASIPFYDVGFKNRRIYTAWDNLKDGEIFIRGVEHLMGAGIPGKHIMAYMLVGYDPAETMERIFKRFDAMRALGILPYPMVYQAIGNDTPGNGIPLAKLRDFQRWVNRRYYQFMPFADYARSSERERTRLHSEVGLFESVPA